MSFMRVTRSHVGDPSAINSEAGRQLVNTLTRTMRSLPGNQSYMAGVDPASGRSIAVGVWDTEEQARYEDVPGDLPARLQALGVKIQSTEVFEVRTPS